MYVCILHRWHCFATMWKIIHIPELEQGNSQHVFSLLFSYKFICTLEHKRMLTYEYMYIYACIQVYHRAIIKGYEYWNWSNFIPSRIEQWESAVWTAGHDELSMIINTTHMNTYIRMYMASLRKIRRKFKKDFARFQR